MSAQHFAWRVGLYHPQQRSAVADLAVAHPAIADLAESFPALLFALATEFGTPERRLAAIEAVVAGQPLQRSAELLGLARWTRKLPAGALRQALPAFPTDGEFSRRMVGLIPNNPAAVRVWLMVVSEALPAGGRHFTLWMARHGVALAGALTDVQRHAFYAWVWMAWHPGTLGQTLIRRPWSADLGIKRVLEEFGAFLGRASLVDALGSGRLGGIVADATVQGLTFKPLRTVHDYMEYAAKLDNCLEQYGERIRHGTAAVAAILDGDDVLGCVEIGPHPTETSMPCIVQLRLKKNRRAPASLWSASYAWLAQCEMRPLMARALGPTDEERAAARDVLWGPYLADLRRQCVPAEHLAMATEALAGVPPRLDTPALRPWPPQAPTTVPFPVERSTLLERLSRLTARTGVRLPRL